jgi:hypothetical protein
MNENYDQIRGVQTSVNQVNDNSFMMMRLNTSPLIEDIKNFLSSKEDYIYQDQTGNIIQDTKQIGLPLANPEGITKICNIVRMTVNQHTAQGNLDEPHYWDIIQRAREEITETIVKKCYDWDIHDGDINTVIDEMLRLIELFLTRPIKNKERDSYNQQFNSREVIAMQPPKSSLSSFAGGIGKR